MIAMGVCQRAPLRPPPHMRILHTPALSRRIIVDNFTMTGINTTTSTSSIAGEARESASSRQPFARGESRVLHTRMYSIYCKCVQPFSSASNMLHTWRGSLGSTVIVAPLSSTRSLIARPNQSKRPTDRDLQVVKVEGKSSPSSSSLSAFSSSATSSSSVSLHESRIGRQSPSDRISQLDFNALSRTIPDGNPAASQSFWYIVTTTALLAFHCEVGIGGLWRYMSERLARCDISEQLTVARRIRETCLKSSVLVGFPRVGFPLSFLFFFFCSFSWPAFGLDYKPNHDLLVFIHKRV